MRRFLSRAALLSAVCAVPVGFFLVRAGERDDSPGLGGIGIMVSLMGLWWLWRHWRRR